MAKALEVTNNSFKIGHSKFGLFGVTTGSVNQIVYDGDTVNVLLDKNLGVRFLGIDTPELAIPLPGSDPNAPPVFTSLSNAKWDAVFTSGSWKNNFVIDPGLMAYLSTVIGNGTGIAKNHHDLAVNSAKALEKIIQGDLDLSGKTKDKFNFFLAFGNEFLDTYARLLCYLNSDKNNYTKKADQDKIKALSYNERQLANGAGLPYFIWPNIQPFVNIKPFSKSFVEPNNFWIMVQNAGKLQKVRKAVANARAKKWGIYDPAKPLILAPHELRFISRGLPPDRYVVDLSAPFSNQLINPERYYIIPNPEDRLYIPKEYAPLFEKNGWVIVY
jgi:hypothetical protein